MYTTDHQGTQPLQPFTNAPTQVERTLHLLMHLLPVPGSHEYVIRTAGSVDQTVAPETTASGSQGRLIFLSPHGRRTGQSTPRNTDRSSPWFVSGTSEIRTHVRLIRRRTLYHFIILIPGKRQRVWFINFFLLISMYNKLHCIHTFFLFVHFKCFSLFS